MCALGKLASLNNVIQSLLQYAVKLYQKSAAAAHAFTEKKNVPAIV